MKSNMMSTEEVVDIALSFINTSSSPHFHKTSFRIKNKIFATLDAQKHELVVKLSLLDQSVFCDMIEAVRPVKGAWGRKGWTSVQYQLANRKAVKDLLFTAYQTVAA